MFSPPFLSLLITQVCGWLFGFVFQMVTLTDISFAIGTLMSYNTF